MVLNQKRISEIIARSNKETELNRIPIKKRLNLLDIRDMCIILGVSRSTLLKLRKSSDFPKHEQHGNKIYWKKSDVENLVPK